MTDIEEREKGFERKFAFDEELRFKATARRNKLLGLWAAEKMKRSGQDAQAYAGEIVLADLSKGGDDDVVARIVNDFKAAGVPASDREIRLKMIDFMSAAIAEVQKS